MYGSSVSDDAAETASEDVAPQLSYSLYSAALIAIVPVALYFCLPFVYQSGPPTQQYSLFAQQSSYQQYSLFPQQSSYNTRLNAFARWW